MKSAFTIIELIFVIVIIGILGSMAIPKMMTTRDDAKVVTIANNVKIIKNDIIQEYSTKKKIKLDNEQDWKLITNIREDGWHFSENKIEYKVDDNDGSLETCLAIIWNPNLKKISTVAKNMNNYFCKALNKRLGFQAEEQNTTTTIGNSSIVY